MRHSKLLKFPNKQVNIITKFTKSRISEQELNFHINQSIEKYINK